MIELSSLLLEQEALRRRLVAVEGLISAYRLYDASTAELAVISSTRSQGASTPATKMPRAAPVMEATEAAVAELLDQRGEPVQLNEIITHLFDAGAPLPSVNVSNVVSARLSNSAKFVGRRGVGWWFADRPWPGEAEIAQLSAQENEPPNGDAAGGSEVEEVAASSAENRVDSLKELLG